MSEHSLHTTGMTLSTASGAFSILVWTGLYIGGMGIPIALPFAILGGIAVLAAFHTWLAVYALFLIRFFPVGLYLLGPPSWFAVIGVLDLTCLAGGVLMHLAGTRADSNGVRGLR
jgi:hypothetical protein